MGLGEVGEVGEKKRVAIVAREKEREKRRSSG